MQDTYNFYNQLTTNISNQISYNTFILFHIVTIHSEHMYSTPLLDTFDILSFLTGTPIRAFFVPSQQICLCVSRFVFPL